MNSIFMRLAVIVAVLAGCSGGSDRWADNLPDTVPASGILTLDGEPLDGASIVLAPVAPGEHAASAVTGSEGEFDLKAFPSKDGVVPGTYKVGVKKEVRTGINPAFDPAILGPDAAHEAESPGAEVWENILPARYADPAASGLNVAIPAEGNTEMKIELNSM